MIQSTDFWRKQTKRWSQMKKKYFYFRCPKPVCWFLFQVKGVLLQKSISKRPLIAIRTKTINEIPINQRCIIKVIITSYRTLSLVDLQSSLLQSSFSIEIYIYSIVCLLKIQLMKIPTNIHSEMKTIWCKKTTMDPMCVPKLNIGCVMNKNM